jgi:murein DD-endopeptidase MepM/ murein hydrolase activator NlpD
MNIEKKILEIYEEINNSKKSLLGLQEASLNAPLDKISVNSPFGPRWGTTHNGVDFAADAAEVKAPADGVVEVGEIKNDDCGGTVIINHADGFKTGFCHLQKINVHAGQEVKQGDVIAISGGGANDPGRGRSDGRHLHFTLRKNGQLLNPMDYINKDDVMTGESPKSSESEDSSKDTSSEIEKPDSIVFNMAKKIGDLFLPSKEKSKTNNEGKQIFKTTSGLSEMIQTKKEFKKFLINEASETSDELFGGSNVIIPSDGAHAGQSGWQSNNAWDIMGKVGTPVYAIADGVLQTFSDYGDKVVAKNGKKLFGQSFTVKSDGDLPSVYYTHLKDSTVEKGSKIQCGQLVGYIMDFPNSDSDHVHIGVESGHNIKEFLNSDGSLKCSSTSGSDSKPSDSSDSSKNTSSEIEKPDSIVFNMAKKIGDLFLPSKEKSKLNTEGKQIEEQRNFGHGVQNRYGRIIIPKEENSKIKSPMSGVVDNSRYSSSCNNQIIIKNENNENFYLQFCGISKPLVSNGENVDEGQVIGMTDNDVEVTLYDSSWNTVPIGDDFERKTPKYKEESKYKRKEEPKYKGKDKPKYKEYDNDRQKNKKQEYYDDPAVALIASLPSMAFDTVFGNRYDKKTGELKQKRWGGVADKRPVDPWVIDAIKKPFTKKVNEDIERIKRLLK